MARGAGVAGRMPIRRIIAAPHEPAAQTDPKVDPTRSDLKALFAAGRRSVNFSRHRVRDVHARIGQIDRRLMSTMHESLSVVRYQHNTSSLVQCAMNELDANGPFAYGGRDAFDASRTDVADCKDAMAAGLKQERRARDRPMRASEIVGR